ncbi:hypothetical protein Y032_0017g3447 [Ancylostoma ceylanicum]|uniref:Uncharacterized protein n=1 Tax=Ancylostoma ceylanicum TaxID=53326 RepID=A0A016V5R6_9BILA|nr:hypothetical protein Y032_0017g3447 [Ancylostoma ceylanicum]
MRRLMCYLPISKSLMAIHILYIGLYISASVVSLVHAIPIRASLCASRCRYFGTSFFEQVAHSFWWCFYEVGQGFVLVRIGKLARWPFGFGKITFYESCKLGEDTRITTGPTIFRQMTQIMPKFSGSQTWQ